MACAGGLIFLMILGVIDLIKNENDRTFLELIAENWWSVVDFLLLIVAASLPLYLRVLENAKRFEREGDFANRMLISLNVCKQASDPGKKGEFFMRTTLEESFGSFFPDLYVQKIVDDAKRTHMPERAPFLQVQTNYADRKRLRDHIKNKISSMSSSGHIMKDMGIPTLEVSYVWALTFEHSKSRDELNDKFRILLIREDFLDKIDAVDIDDVNPKHVMEDDQQAQYFRDRWRNLQLLKAIFPSRVKDGLLADTVSLTLPGALESKHANAWDSWKGQSPNAVTLDDLEAKELYIEMKN